MAGNFGVLGVDGENLAAVAQLVQVFDDLKARAGLLRGADDGNGLGAEQRLQLVPRVEDPVGVRHGVYYFLPFSYLKLRRKAGAKQVPRRHNAADSFLSIFNIVLRRRGGVRLHKFRQNSHFTAKKHRETDKPIAQR